MQIVIPMSGFGERFRRAGYSVPKPLIEMEGKPIIAHVIDMFPGESDFLFICNQEHLNEPSYRLEEVLAKYCPSGKVVGIEPHKLGPIYAVLKVAELVKDDEPVVVNYCDFTCFWDWDAFKQHVANCECDGAIPAYRGFHPHTLGTTNYAYIKEEGGWIKGIQEKQPYTNNRMEEYASSGTYYFSSGALMKNIFAEVVEKDINVGGEYYVSLAYIPLIERQAKISVYELQHFMQWGTPADVDEYNAWSAIFRRLLEPASLVKTKRGAVVVPMAGMGKRFVDEGYRQTKPLIPVSGRPMVFQACSHLPSAEKYAFVLRKDMPGYDQITQAIAGEYSGAELVCVPEVTEGQAVSAKIGLDALPQYNGPVTFGACDFAALYDEDKLDSLLDEGCDVIVWAVRGHINAIRKPEMFGWIDADENGVVKGVSVKKPLANPDKDPIVLGTFTFKSPKHFYDCYQSLINRDGRINNEFYLDSCVNDALALGMSCKIFEVDFQMSWGTPNDLRTFEYWQSCFHNWSSHPYSLEMDPLVPEPEVARLQSRYQVLRPEVSGKFKC